MIGGLTVMLFAALIVTKSEGSGQVHPGGSNGYLVSSSTELKPLVGANSQPTVAADMVRASMAASVPSRQSRGMLSPV